MQGKDLSTVLNAIRATSSSAYQTNIPLATATNIVDVGKAVLAAPSAIRNEFMSNLYNKIGLTLIDSPVIENEFAFLRKGVLEYGQAIEDIYVGLAKSEPYVTGMKEEDEIPDPFSIKKLPHMTAFYSTILSRQYQVTRHLTDLKKAFHNGNGLEQFIAGMMNSMISGENWDDMRASIALIARQIEEGIKDAKDPEGKFKGAIHLITDFNKIYPDEVVTSENCMHSKNFLKYMTNQIKKYSRRISRPREDFNLAGVLNSLPKNRQRIIMIEDIAIDFETELLAWAYNQGNLELSGIDYIDAWYSIGATGEKTVISPEDIKVKGAFSSVKGDAPCVACIYDEEMVKIYNKERVASEQANNKGNYWNMFMSLEDIYACSPFRNFVAFLLD